MKDLESKTTDELLDILIKSWCSGSRWLNIIYGNAWEVQLCTSEQRIFTAVGINKSLKVAVIETLTYMKDHLNHNYIEEV